MGQRRWAGIWARGTFFDLTQSVANQPEGGTPSSIRCYKLADRDLSTEGGIWFESRHDPDAPGTGAFYAAGPAFVLEGNAGLLRRQRDAAAPKGGRRHRRSRR